MTDDTTKKHPADVCYMVADLKYNTRDSVKICEIQQASLSLFNGDTYRDLPEEQSIHKELLRTLSLYNKHGWVVSEGIADKNLIANLANSSHWQNPKDLMALFADKGFRDTAKLPPSDIYDLSTYKGFLYINWSKLSVIYDFDTRLAGVAPIDKSSFPLWIDKYRMTRLFAEDAILAKVKPKWGNYKKVYTKELADTIAVELGSETFVIKPRGNFMGKGVIITTREDLDEVLHYIITKKGRLAESKDSAYRAWKNDTFDSFIVEEFITSDPIKLPHLESKTYQPTMRVAFLLVYNKQRHHVHFLGEYWKTPKLSVDEEGDFMSKNKDICEPPYYLAVDDATRQIVRDELSIALPMLHHNMLHFSPDSPEEYYAPVRNGGLQMVLQEITTI
ncbi:MAG TPA: hypothetical protein VLG09_01820 [Candidatus Saccharimonadales bacterium]|nr:hypothetical protein [Candidatus Saccharimonadales bacterium]